MKQYKKIYSYGCSFTEGGGLNAQDYHRYINGDTNYSLKPENVLPEHTEYANHHSFPGYLSRLLNCEFKNNGTSRAANELIFNMAYDEISGLEDTTDILVTIQTSMLSRMLLQMPYENKQITLNNFVDLEGSVKTFYELYVCEFFDIKYAYKKLLQDVDVYNSWFASKNIDVVWILYDTPDYNAPSKPYIVDLDGRSLCGFAGDNELRLVELPNFPYKDLHLSPKGNEVVANRIYEHLKRKYG